MYENEFEALTIKLERALEKIQGLVIENDALAAERNSLSAGLQYTEGDLLSEKRRFADVAHQRDHLFQQNQRLPRDARDRGIGEADRPNIGLTRLQRYQSTVTG